MRANQKEAPPMEGGLFAPFAVRQAFRVKLTSGNLLFLSPPGGLATTEWRVVIISQQHRLRGDERAAPCLL
jgi:hypothetical protein